MNGKKNLGQITQGINELIKNNKIRRVPSKPSNKFKNLSYLRKVVNGANYTKKKPKFNDPPPQTIEKAKPKYKNVNV